MKLAIILATVIAMTSLKLQAQTPDGDLTYQWVEDLIKTKNLTRIESVIENLPLEYKQNFVLMHHSKSIQGASLEFPRAILFGKSAQLMMAFNGEKKEKNYRTLEMIEFNEKTKQFEMHVIDFSNKKPTFSELNPSKCLSCHGEQPSPFWESYAQWPGAYGESDDYVTAAETKMQKSKKLRWHLRYRTLFTGQGSSFPYRTDSDDDHRFRPNNRLLKNLIRRQARANAEYIKNLNSFNTNQAAVIFGLINCATDDQKIEQIFKILYPNNFETLMATFQANKALLKQLIVFGNTEYNPFTLTSYSDTNEFSDGANSLSTLTAVSLIPYTSGKLQTILSPYRVSFCTVFDEYNGNGSCSMAVGKIADDYDKAGQSADLSISKSCDSLSELIGLK